MVHDKIRRAFDLVRVHAEIDIEIATDEVELIDLDTDANVDLTIEACLLHVEQNAGLALGQLESFGVYDIEEVREDVTTLYAHCLADLADG